MREDLRTLDREIKRATTSWEDCEDLTVIPEIKRHTQKVEEIQEALKTYRKWQVPRYMGGDHS